MNICIITDDMAKVSSPMMKDVMRLLEKTHKIDIAYMTSLAEAYSSALIEGPLADLYLLKSHSPVGLEAARQLEERGAHVVNSWQATRACQDRNVMSTTLLNAGLPYPRTWYLDSLARDIHEDLLTTLPFPLVVKARYAYEGTMVDKVNDAAQLRCLAMYWGKKPVVLQECLPNDGWDTKLWVIGEQIFAAKRRSPINEGMPDEFQLMPDEIDEKCKSLALEAGRIFGLQVYVVDFINTPQGPVIVDVNSFPRFRGLFGPDKALVAFVERACCTYV
ncbi:alpha-L-glutamate ligase [Ktedonosporobacter rubrisoli]|uniref:Alpha-L-glutamate ligase n=1 Tax=Ktedonosporobacter rubrisoli TaxID=2509675 RepID=A0A4P6JQZ6_KTERU|nr:alpha-L-glutamate ligase [Ktedonosporobacter rubrisoli]QBD77610.1 alpha-L-glutamate ligase [Ktedonosporobacter rubrisoli]